MGIPSYFSYIVKNHSNIIRKLSDNPIIIDNLYLDCNSIIYDAVYKMEVTAITEDVSNIIILRVINIIKEYVNLLKPTNCLFIAFDGVAPVAKLDQQRSRRFKSLYQNSLSRAIHKNVGSDPWNTTAITPGTIFMKTLDEKIVKAFENPDNFNLKNIIVSGSNFYGEGEHKIFEYIRNNTREHSDKHTVIYGLDADLIMLSINHLPIAPNIYLFRETPEFIKSINSELEPNESYVLDIPELANIITLDMNNGSEILQKNRIYDYIFMCFFLGNDFMPHFPSINIRTGGVDKMLQAYKATIGNTNDFLTDGKTIYWKNVRKLVKFLADNELNFIKHEHKIRDRKEKNKMPNITAEEKINEFVNIPTYERALEKFINPYKDNWQQRYYKTLFEVEIDEVRRKQICTNYLEGLEWTMKYYTSGCPDWRWRYNYNYPPLLQDLIDYIPFFNTEYYIPYCDTDFVVNKPHQPVSELVQLCYVLPRQSLQMLPENLYNNLIKKNSHLYTTDCEFSWAYCKYFWECHPNLPHIDVNELEDFVKNNK
jgi:5'-3' exoribonuclease 1